MDCKTTFIRNRPRGGYTLVEFMVSAALGTLALAVICWATLYGSRAFAAMANYLALDQQSQQTLDKMSREIREADHLTSFASNDLTFVDNTGATVEYNYNTNAQKLYRITGGVTNAYLTNCDSLYFSIYQRTPISNSFEPYSTTTYTNAKVIELDWHCFGNLNAASANTESIQSAKIVIRNH